jgi:S1-C subfamily serine protease
VTDGIISSIRGKSQLLQITAAISPDSSGSPIFNTKGEVIGVATFLLKGDPSLNFAVPVSLVQDLLKHPKKRSTSEAAPRLTRQQQLMTTKPAPLNLKQIPLIFKPPSPQIGLFFNGC